MSTIAWLLRGLSSLLAPPRCAACRASVPLEPGLRGPHGPGDAWRALVCAACRADVLAITSGCPGCGASRGPFAAPASRCAACRVRPLEGVSRTTALLRYRGPARRLLHALKYEGREDLGPPLGRSLGARVLLAGGGVVDPDLVVVPVPLHALRRIVRGYNQAEGVAEGVAEALARPLAPVLRRARRTRALHGVPREAREAVVQGAFEARADLGGRPALLVDDIRTSGATLRAAAAALLAAGASSVEAAIVAR